MGILYTDYRGYKTRKSAKTEDGLKVQVNTFLGEKPKYKGKLLTYSFETPYLNEKGSSLEMQKKKWLIILSKS